MARTIAITGAGGLIGWHVYARLRALPGVEVHRGGREVFANGNSVDSFLSGADIVLHLAGRTRGSDDEILGENEGLAKAIADSLHRLGSSPHVFHASSIQVSGDTAYARSKRQAGETLALWAAQAGAAFTDMILPHVFGEGGRPFHNSAVSTFCHLLARGAEPAIDADRPMELIHAQEIAQEIANLLDAPPVPVWRPNGRHMRVSELLQHLQALRADYSAHLIPDLRDDFDLALFNTYRSYLYPDHYPVALEPRTDEHDTLVEAIRELNGGQTYYSTTQPGAVRGQHYHLRKVERFLVLSGEAALTVRKVGDTQVRTFRLSGSVPAYLDIPTLHVHSLRNVCDEDLIALFWSHDLHDPARADTIAEPVA